VAFLFVYIREAHPTDEWQLDDNVKEGVLFAQATTHGERKTVATACRKALELTMPVIVDEIDDRVDNAWAGWPERIFVVDPAGRVAYAAKQGPWGFKPDELRAWLEANIGKAE
jgi:hypothetical protein